MAQTYRGKQGDPRNVPKEPIPPNNQPNAQVVADVAASVAGKDHVNLMASPLAKHGISVRGIDPLGDGNTISVEGIFPKSHFAAVDRAREKFKEEHDGMEPPPKYVRHVMKAKIGEGAEIRQTPREIGLSVARGESVIIPDAEYKKEVTFLRKRYPELPAAE